MARLAKGTTTGPGTGGGSFPSIDDPHQPPHADEFFTKLAHAVSVAEGFQKSARAGGGFLTSNKAYTHKNPGDIFNSQGQLRQYPTFRAGWIALYDLLERIYEGRSSYYRLNMPLTEVARIYVVGPFGDPASQPYINWANNVAAELGVPVNTTLRDLRLYIT